MVWESSLKLPSSTTTKEQIGKLFVIYPDFCYPSQNLWRCRVALDLLFHSLKLLDVTFMGMQFLDMPTIYPYNPHQPPSRQTNRKAREFQSFWPFNLFFWGGRGVATGHLLRFGEQKTHVVVVIRATAPRNVTKLYGSWEDNQSIFLAHLGVAVA